MLLAGGIGSAIASWFSSEVVTSTGSVRDALLAGLAIQGVVLMSVVLLSAFFRERQSDAATV